jgi:hypothetical protein
VIGPGLRLKPWGRFEGLARAIKSTKKESSGVMTSSGSDSFAMGFSFMGVAATSGGPPCTIGGSGFTTKAAASTGTRGKDRDATPPHVLW